MTAQKERPASAPPGAPRTLVVRNRLTASTKQPQQQVLLIEIAPVYDDGVHRDRLSAALDGAVLVASTATPFLDAARKLRSLGYPADAVLTMRHAGSDVIAVRAKVGVAAKLEVGENGQGSPRFKRYRTASERGCASPPASADAAPLSQGPPGPPADPETPAHKSEEEYADA